jgi:hypothetical protein
MAQRDSVREPAAGPAEAVAEQLAEGLARGGGPARRRAARGLRELEPSRSGRDEHEPPDAADAEDAVIPVPGLQMG